MLLLPDVVMQFFMFYFFQCVFALCNDMRSQPFADRGWMEGLVEMGRKSEPRTWNRVQMTVSSSNCVTTRRQITYCMQKQLGENVKSSVNPVYKETCGRSQIVFLTCILFLVLRSRLPMVFIDILSR